MKGERKFMKSMKALLLPLIFIFLVSFAFAQGVKDVKKEVKKSDEATSPSAKLAKPQVSCPVCGAKIDKTLYTDYKGKKIYFDNQGCIDQFKKDPAKYSKKPEGQRKMREHKEMKTGPGAKTEMKEKKEAGKPETTAPETK